jgi:hypothetical protein
MSRFPARHNGHTLRIVRLEDSPFDETFESNADVPYKIGNARREYL